MMMWGNRPIPLPCGNKDRCWENDKCPFKKLKHKRIFQLPHCFIDGETYDPYLHEISDGQYTFGEDIDSSKIHDILFLIGRYLRTEDEISDEDRERIEEMRDYFKTLGDMIWKGKVVPIK